MVTHDSIMGMACDEETINLTKGALGFSQYKYLTLSLILTEFIKRLAAPALAELLESRPGHLQSEAALGWTHETHGRVEANSLERSRRFLTQQASLRG
jgi:hypothetical protein